MLQSRSVRNTLWRMATGCAVAGVVGAAIAVGFTAYPEAQARRGPQGFIEGTVQSTAGPEAGVWVIAETNELQTKFVKIVVTDDQGRFVLPEMPPAQYSVWVRGYGLVDSKPVTAKVGDKVSLKADVAKTPARQRHP
jgi:hypothetical protein